MAVGALLLCSNILSVIIIRNTNGLPQANKVSALKIIEVKSINENTICMSCNTSLQNDLLFNAVNSTMKVENVFNEDYFRESINKCSESTNLNSSQLNMAVSLNNTQIVRQLITHIVDSDCTDDDNNTALHYAAFNGNIPVISSILAKNVRKINSKNNKGETPLLISAKQNNTSLFEAILRKGGNPYDYGHDNSTSLHIASELGNIDIVKDILKISTEGINIQDIKRRTALHLAAESNNSRIYECLLNHGADPHIKDSNGDTPLHLGITQMNENIVNMSVQNSQSTVGIMNAYGATALHTATSLGLTKISELLLSNGADPKVTDNHGRSTLHLAARMGLLKVAKRIINEYPIEINKRDFDGYTAFHFAAFYNHSDIVELLLSKNADPFIPNNKKITPLHSIVAQNNLRLASIILNQTNKGINMQSLSGGTALLFAVNQDNYEIVKLLIDYGADPNIKNNDGMTPLHISAKFGNTGISQMILTRYKISINALNKKHANALYIASYYNKPEMVQFLLNKKADPTLKNSNGNLPLHAAAERGFLGVVQVLLNNSKDYINKRNDMGSTPLYSSTYYNKTAVVEELLKNGADPDIPIINGKLPLHTAALKSNKIILTEILKKTKLQINIQSMDGSTVLHMVCESDAHQIVEFLMSSGADPNIATYEGWLPLHLCAQFGHSQTSNLLIGKTKNINTQNNHVLTPLMVAMFNRKQEMVKLLLEHGADPNISDSGGRNIIHIAAEEDATEILEILINKKNISIDLQDVWGFTPLLWAINKNKVKVAEYLLNNNANVSISNIFNHNAFHYLPRIQNKTAVKHIFEEITLRLPNNVTNLLINQQDLYGITPLFLAAQVPNEEVFFLLLEKGANVKSIDFKGYSLLHHIGIGGSVKIAKYILDKTHISINSVSYNKITPIMFAASNQESVLFDFLLEKKVKLEGITAYGITLLHFAAKGGNVHNTLTVLDRRVDSAIDTPDVEGYTPLMTAVQNNRWNTTRLLMLKGADPILDNIYKENAITLSAKFATLDILLLFDSFEYDADYVIGNALSRKRDRDSGQILYYLIQKCSIRNNQLFYASATGNDDLLSNTLDNLTSLHPLYFRTYHKRFPTIMEQFLKDYDDAVKELLNEDDDTPPFNDYMTPLEVSLLFFGKLSTIKLLIEKLNINVQKQCKNKKWTPLDFAIFRGNPDLLDFILNLCNGTVSKATNKYGWTAVHKAVWAGNLNAFAVLKKFGANYIQGDMFNRTPLHIAAIKGNRFMVRTIIKLAKESIDSKDIHGFTPLHLLMIYGQGRFFSRLSTSSSNLPTSMRYKFASLGVERDAYDYYASALTLINMKADLNAQDKAFGWTPLHWAALNGEEWMAHMLVSKGASVNLPSWDDETPMKLARKWGKVSIYNYLKSKGGIW